MTEQPVLVFICITILFISFIAILYLLTQLKRKAKSLESLVDDLKKSEQRVSRAEKIVHLGHWELDLLSDEAFLSNEFFQILGVRPEDKKYMKEFVFSKIHPDDLKESKSIIERAIKEKSKYKMEHRIVRPNGEVRVVNSIGAFELNDKGAPNRLIGAYLDITERKELESKKTQSVKLYKSIVNNFPNGTISLYDTDGRYITTGGKNYDKNDYSPEDLIGKKYTEVLPEKIVENLSPIFQAALKGESRTFEIETGNRYLLASCVPIRDKERNIKWVLGMTQDITDRRRYEKDISEKNRLLEDILYMASHDLRAPLVNIGGFCHELRITVDKIKEITGSDKESDLGDLVFKHLDEYTNFIEHGTSHLEQVLSGLLIVGKTGKINENIEVLDMNVLLDSVFENFFVQISKEKVELNLDNLPKCFGDEKMLSQVFSNLIDNSIKYRKTDIPLTIDIGAKEKGDYVIYSFTDNGIGIDKKHKDDIFKIFFRVENRVKKKRGEGIGLTIVRMMLERLKGSIWLDQEYSDGTRFFISLPRAL